MTTETASTASRLAELQAQRDALAKNLADLNGQIASAKKEEAEGVIAQIKALMAQYNLTVADLGPRVGSKKKEDKPAGTRSVAPKFRNEATGETWSGRGLKPKWLSAALESGKSLEDFAINA